MSLFSMLCRGPKREKLHDLAVDIVVNPGLGEQMNKDVIHVKRCYVVPNLKCTRISPAFFERIRGHRNYVPGGQMTLLAEIWNKPGEYIRLQAEVNEGCKGDMEISSETKRSLIANFQPKPIVQALMGRPMTKGTGELSSQLISLVDILNRRRSRKGSTTA